MGRFGKAAHPHRDHHRPQCLVPEDREYRVDAGPTRVCHSGRQIVYAGDRTNDGGSGRIVFSFLDSDNHRATLCIGKGDDLAEQLVASGCCEIPPSRPRIRAISVRGKFALKLQKLAFIRRFRAKRAHVNSSNLVEVLVYRFKAASHRYVNYLGRSAATARGWGGSKHTMPGSASASFSAKRRARCKSNAARVH